MVPVQFVLFTIIAIIGSAILYQDFRQVSSAQALNFVFACAFIFTGVYILARDSEGENEAGEEDRGSALNSRSPLDPVPEHVSPLIVHVRPSHPPRSLSLRGQPPVSPIPHVRRRTSQPMFIPRTPGYYLIAATSRPRPTTWISRSLGNHDPAA